jgi:hypothetical protein
MHLNMHMDRAVVSSSIRTLNFGPGNLKNKKDIKASISKSFWCCSKCRDKKMMKVGATPTTASSNKNVF